MSIAYQAVLPLREDTVLFLTGLLDLEQARRRTRTGTRSLSTRDQAILVLRWFLDDTRMSQLARDTASAPVPPTTTGTRRSGSWPPAGPDYGALLEAKVAGHSHVILDGTLIATNRSRRPGPTPGVDLWWSGKHKHHGGNVQVLSAPDGWPLWTSAVRPGREHDTTAARADPLLRQQITEWVQDGGLALADLGYQGEAHLFRLPAKKPNGGQLTEDQQAHNGLHSALRCLGERANSLLKTTSRILTRIRGCPWRIGDITAAALVLLHIENNRTT
jgi:hypothetical protein